MEWHHTPSFLMIKTLSKKKKLYPLAFHIQRFFALFQVWNIERSLWYQSSWVVEMLLCSNDDNRRTISGTNDDFMGTTLSLTIFCWQVNFRVMKTRQRNIPSTLSRGSSSSLNSQADQSLVNILFRQELWLVYS